MTHSFTDQMQRKVELPFPPQRIVSLVPSQTELLHSLGLEEEVVGITRFCIHPEAWFRSKTRVGGTKQLKVAAIDALQPGLIIGNKEENTKEEIEQLAEKYPLWMSDIHTLDDALDMIRRVGQLVGKEEPAHALAARVEAGFQELEASLAGAPAIRTAYFIWRRPYMVAAANTFIQSMLEQAGLENVFAGHQRYPEVSLEELARQQPELLLLSSEPYPFREKHFEAFRQACPTAAIQLVDGEMFSWYGSRLLLSASYFRLLRTRLVEAKR